MGRPASPLAIRADREFFVGVKITGDELIGVVCDLTAQVRAVVHRRLGSSAVDDVLTEIAAIVGDLLDDGPFRGRTRRLGLAVSGEARAKAQKEHPTAGVTAERLVTDVLEHVSPPRP